MGFWAALLLLIFASSRAISVAPSIPPRGDDASVKVAPAGRPRTPLAAKSKSKLGAAERAAMLTAGSQRPGDQNSRVSMGGSVSTKYYVMNVEFSSQLARMAFRMPDAQMFAAYGPFADVFVSSVDVAEAIAERPDVRRAEPAEVVKLPPPPPVMPGAVKRGILQQEEIVRGGLDGLTGRGVIIAVLDTGVDFRSPDFINYQGGAPNSRLMYFWDTLSDAYERGGLGSRPPLSFPNGQPIGTLYTRAQLTQELRSGQARIPTPDENGHGTAVAGIAAGNGNSSHAQDRRLFQGVAPGADIIGIRLGGAYGEMSNGYLLNAAVEWLTTVAQRSREPLVINCSFGGQEGAHDGSSIFERHLSARFAPSSTGRAIVFAAGNERQYGVHAKVSAAGREAGGYLVWNARAQEAHLDIFLRPLQNFFFRPGDLRYDPLTTNCILSTGCLTRFNHEYPLEFNPLTSEWKLALDVPQGMGGIEVYTESGTPLSLDAYIVGAPETAEFLAGVIAGGRSVRVAYQGEEIGYPATASNAITVGSYDWNRLFDGLPKACEQRIPIILGALSCYSNPGYSRAADIKPEIVAPGEIYAATYAHTADGRGVNAILPPEMNWTVDASNNLVLMNGTSAASPYVAGVIALIMQKKPGISAGEIRQLLREHATQVPDRWGASPNPDWGYGKLDLTAVQAILNAVH